jgi:Flp pilus assembly protein TadD
MTKWIIPLGAALLISAMAAGQAQNPATKAFTFTEVDLKLLDEVELLEQQFEKRGLVYNNPELTAFLQGIGDRLLGQTGPEERVRWRFHVLRDPMINAFALPSGAIYFNSGLLALLEDESQLASVAAHEITHVTSRHTYYFNRSIRKKMVVMHILAAAGSAGGYMPAGSVFGLTLQLASAVSQVVLTATIFGYSQDQERDADRIGLDLLSGARYDPQAMPRTLKLLDEKLEAEPVQTFYRTHPKLVERTSYTSGMAAAKAVADLRTTPVSDYLGHVEGVIRYNVEADISSRRYRTAVARASRLTAWKPEDAVFMSVLANAYRELGPRTAEPTERELSGRGQSDARRRLVGRTVEEDERDLLASSPGKEAAKANEEKAERLYREAISRNPELAEPHRGLGMLFEDQGRVQEAADEYKEYLRLAPSAIDRLRIERRIEGLQKPQLIAPPGQDD